MYIAPMVTESSLVVSTVLKLWNEQFKKILDLYLSQWIRHSKWKSVGTNLYFRESEYYFPPLQDETPNLTLILQQFLLQQGLNQTHQFPRSHWFLSPHVQSCTRCRPSSVPAGQTQTLVRSAPWHCTGSSDPASEADEGGAAGVQSWTGEPRRSEEERQVWRA